MIKQRRVNKFILRVEFHKELITMTSLMKLLNNKQGGDVNIRYNQIRVFILKHKECQTIVLYEMIVILKHDNCML